MCIRDRRLIIYSDLASNEDEEKKLRYFGIVYEDNANPGQWFAATQGIYLPEGIYFNKDLSKEYPASSTMKINYPRQSAQSGSSGEEYYYYEFNSNGTMATNYDNTWLAIQAGTLKPNSGGVLGVDFTEIENEGLKAALIFRRVGTTTLVSDPTDIY